MFTGNITEIQETSQILEWGQAQASHISQNKCNVSTVRNEWEVFYPTDDDIE